MTDPYVVITLDGIPRGKGRPRGRIIKSKKGPAFISFYTDAETREYEERMARVGALAMRGRAVLDEPLAVVVDAYLPIPASWPRGKYRQAVEGEIFPVGKPDADNFGKIALDSLNGIVFRDDSLIVRMTIQKHYDLDPALRVSVWKWG